MARVFEMTLNVVEGEPSALRKIRMRFTATDDDDPYSNIFSLWEEAGPYVFKGEVAEPVSYNAKGEAEWSDFTVGFQLVDDVSTCREIKRTRPKAVPND